MLQAERSVWSRTAALRYLSYVLLISLVTWGLTALETNYAGLLKLRR